MTLAAIVLMAPVVIHALWNLAGKRQDPSPRFFLIANTVGCLCLTPAVLTHVDVIFRLPRIVCVLLVVTGIFQAAYYAGLAGAYRTGHLSVAYPIARSCPVVMAVLR